LTFEEVHMQNTTRLNHGQLLASAGESATLWRVKEGVLRLDQVNHDATILVQLVFPGDLVGVEALCAEPYAYTITALTRCKLQAESVAYDFNRFAAVAQGYMQQQERTRDMMRMRTGSVRDRLAYFLKLMSQNSDGSTRKLERRELPTQKEIAVILDVASETVCRELNAFMPAKVYKRGPRMALGMAA
jgi:CRP-like cAMP-binding protein